MDATLTETEPKAERFKGWGWGLIACAFAKPLATAAVGGDPTLQGERIGQMLMALLVMLVVLGLVMKKRSTSAKSIARVVVSLVLLCISVIPRAQTGPTDAERVYNRDYQALNARQTAAMLELGKRFDVSDLASSLSAESLTTRAGVTKARANVAKYRALLAERRHMLATTSAETEKFFNTQSPSEADRKAAFASYAPNKALATKLNGTLDSSQSAYADAVSAIVDWFAAQKGTVGSKDGQFTFSNQKQQMQLVALAKTLEAAENRVNADVKEGAVIQAEAAKRTAAANRQMADMLVK